MLVWCWRLLLLRQQEDRRGTDDDVRLRMRHTAAKIVWKLVLARGTCFFPFCCVRVWRAGVSCTYSRSQAVLLPCSIELVRQGLSSTWNRSTHPLTCRGRLASAATTTSTVP